jgi:hypothetical protein
MSALKVLQINFDFALFEQIMGEERELAIPSQPDTIRSILRERIIQNIGPTFESMYNKHFLKGCSYCNYYPTEF